MRTNYSGFALAVCMGLLVVTIGLLALSVGGLVQLGPTLDEAAATPQCGNTAPVDSSYREVSSLVATPSQLAGDALFKNNCAQCHAVHDKVVGPALAGITKRRQLPWLTAWVHNSSKVIASGDGYATQLFENNGKQQMPAFPQLSDNDIADIMQWVEFQEAAGPAAPVALATLKRKGWLAPD